MGRFVESQKSRIFMFQPALPAYRIDFFEQVSRRLGEGFVVHYSPTDVGTLSMRSSELLWAKRLAPMRRLFPGLDWQPGVLSTPLMQGDIVVVSGAPRNISNMLMLAWARRKGARTIWWGHYWSSTSKSHRFLLRLLLMRLADAILFYTDGEVEEYRAAQGKRDRRIVTALNNGINVEPIAALRQPYHANARENAILFIGRLTKKPELPVLLKALSDQRLHNVRLEVVGDGPEKRALETLAKELGVDERIAWHGGTTDEKMIAGIANKCRLFVYPGGVGLSLLHAMAYGLPAVVHDDRYNHMPEIAAFYSANNGLSFAYGDAGSLADAIMAALEVTATDTSWSEAAIRVTENTFNTKQMSDRFCALIEKLRTGGERNAS
jgi:glycosyltransferase involved in cell wall biosynthesis